jgi:hypothetical protein
VSKMRVLLAVPPEHREGDPRALELVWHGDSIKVSIRGSGIQSDAIAGLELLIDGIPPNQADGEAFLHDINYTRPSMPKCLVARTLCLSVGG